MKVPVAENAGFCFGVKRATDRLQEALTQARPGERICTLGHLIHNESYNALLERQGVSARKKPGADEEAERPARQFDKKRYYGSFGAERQRPNQVHAPSPVPAASEKPKFNLGDRVVHRAFGKGEITKVTPMGGDALIEITFDEVGVKRLMLRAASQHMKKET